MNLHRHQLVHLSAVGWRLVLASAAEGTTGDCLRYWAEHRLPLVVTRQRGADVPEVDDHVALGVAASLHWQRKRISISVPRACVSDGHEFPRLDSLWWAWPTMLGPGWRALIDGLASLDTPAYVYGSWGWQLATGLAYVHDGSDVDLWFPVHDTDHADRIAEALAAHAPESGPRIDGELVFPDGTAVAWREWRDWRTGRCREVLVKSLAGAALRSAWD